MDNEKIYVSSSGERLPVESINNFQLVNGLIKSARLGVQNVEAEKNVQVLKDEVLRRLAPKV